MATVQLFLCLPHGLRREKIQSVVASIIASKLYCSKFCQRSVTVIILFENNAILITFIPDKLHTSSTLSHYQVLLHWSFLLIASKSIWFECSAWQVDVQCRFGIVWNSFKALWMHSCSFFIELSDYYQVLFLSSHPDNSTRCTCYCSKWYYFSTLFPFLCPTSSGK